jgi:hypothetical protein
MFCFLFVREMEMKERKKMIKNEEKEWQKSGI